LVVPCHQNDALYSQAQNYLGSILQDKACRPFDPNLLDTYKELQGLPKEEIESGVYVLPLAWDAHEMKTLANTHVLLVGDASEEHKLFKRIDSEEAQLAIRAHDLSGGAVRYFAASIYGQGGIFPDNPQSSDIAFGERHLAVRNGTQLPLLASTGESHARDTLRRFRFHIELSIGDELPADLRFTEESSPTAEAKWRTDEQDTKKLVQAEHPSQEEQLANISNAISAGQKLLHHTTEDGAPSRVVSWLANARHRRLRTPPPRPKVLHVVFSADNSSKQLPASFAALDQEFQAKNLPSLRSSFEQPLLQAYYQEHTTPKSTPDASKGPQVRKLLRRYRLL